jgi:hypothetical protein
MNICSGGMDPDIVDTQKGVGQSVVQPGGEKVRRCMSVQISQE